MIISDDSDEDADTLDDDALVGKLVSPDPLAPASRAIAAEVMLDWPPADAAHVRVALGSKTVRWFKANHADWVGQMDAVLRAWIYAQERRRG